MQRIVVDTNVIVSSLIQRSYPYLIIYELFIKSRITLCLSDSLLAEYVEVLSRPKFARFPDFYLRAEILLADIEIKSAKYDPNKFVSIIADEPDNRILELADECTADFIITGNTNDFTFSFYKETRIVTPREYWENYRPE